MRKLILLSISLCLIFLALPSSAHAADGVAGGRWCFLWDLPLIHRLLPAEPDACLPSTAISPVTESNIEVQETPLDAEPDLETLLPNAGNQPPLENTIIERTTYVNSLVSYRAGDGIRILDNQIFNSGILALSSGSGITVDGSKITNDDRGSSQNIFKNFKVDGQSTITAGGNDESVTFVAGDGISLTTNASDKKLTIASTVSPGGANGWTAASGLTSLSTLTNDVAIGGSSSLGKFSIFGDTNEKQFVLRGVSGQSQSLFELQDSDGNYVAKFDHQGNLAFAIDKGITLTSNRPTSGSIARLLTFKATSEYDRPWMSFVDHLNRHGAALGLHHTNYTDGDLHKKWELKTSANSSGPLAGTMLTRFAVGYDADIVDVIFGDIDTIGVHNDYGDRIEYVARMRNAANTDSVTIGQWITELGDADSTVMSFDTLTMDNTKAATMRFFRETNTSGQKRLVVNKGDGTGAEAFAVNAGTGLVQVFSTGESMIIGDAGQSNTRAFINFSGTRAQVGYDGSYALLQGGPSKGVKINVNQASFGQGTVVTIAPEGTITFNTLNTAGGVLTTDGTGLLSSIAGSAGQCLVSNGTSAPSWQSCATGGASSGSFTIASGTLQPINQTLDLLIGGTSTSSAKFAVLNVNSGTPVASVSAGATGATFISSAGTMQTTLNRTLTIGGNTTGNIILSPLNGSGRVGIGTAAPSVHLDVFNASSPEMRLSRSTSNFFRMQKRSSTGTQIADYANTGEAQLDFDPIPSDGTSKSTVRLFRSVTTTDAGTGFSIYAADGTSSVQSFFSAKGSSYFNALAGNFGVGTASPMAKFDLVGTATMSATLAFNGTTADPKIDVLNGKSFSVRTSNGGLVGLNERMTILTNGNVGLGVTSPTHPLQLATGAYSDSGGAWQNSSDRNLKTNFEAVNPEEILAKIADLPITEWNYKSQSTSFRHIGPMAQDFYQIFGLGGNDTSISTIDPSGVALVGIQGLNQKVDRLSSQVATQPITQTSFAQLDLQDLELDTLKVEQELEVRGNLITRALATFSENVIFEKTATFVSEVIFQGRAVFAKTPLFNQDTAGIAVIKTGANQVVVNFSEAYVNAPQVTANIAISEGSMEEQQQLEKVIFKHDLKYLVSQIDSDSFVIRLNTAAPADIPFNWIAIGVKDVRRSEGTELISPIPVEDVLPTQPITTEPTATPNTATTSSTPLE